MTSTDTEQQIADIGALTKQSGWKAVQKDTTILKKDGEKFQKKGKGVCVCVHAHACVIRVEPGFKDELCLK